MILSSAFALSLGSVHPVILACISSSHHVEYAVTTVTYVCYLVVLSLGCVLLYALKHFPRKLTHRSRLHISRMRTDRMRRLWIGLRKPPFLQTHLSYLRRHPVPVFVAGLHPSTLVLCVDPAIDTVYDLYKMIADRISPAPFNSALYNIFHYSFQSSPLPIYRL